MYCIFCSFKILKILCIVTSWKQKYVVSHLILVDCRPGEIAWELIYRKRKKNSAWTNNFWKPSPSVCEQFMNSASAPKCLDSSERSEEADTWININYKSSGALSNILLRPPHPWKILYPLIVYRNNPDYIFCIKQSHHNSSSNSII